MRILFFYPENPLLLNQGNNARVYALLEYFKSSGITIDLVGQQQHREELYTQNDLNELKGKNLIDKGFILKRTKHKGLKYFFYSIKQKLDYFFKRKVKDYNRLRMGQKEAFLEVFNAEKYDYLLLSYVYNYSLIENVDLVNTKTIIDTHDFLTSQFKKQKNFKLGRYFEQEIKILSQFDAVWAISIEEQYLFSQFVDNEVKLIPHALQNNFDASKKEKTIDLFYVASDNGHNIKAAQWFLNNVYPLLDSTIKIVVVGKVAKHIPDFSNIEKIEYVVNLDDFYSKTKVVICPMLSGTGLKIKVVEALSYGLPVVCNTRGVDGLLNKIDNGCLVTDDSEKMADYIKKLLSDSIFYSNIQAKAVAFFDSTISQAKVHGDLDRFFSK